MKRRSPWLSAFATAITLLLVAVGVEASAATPPPPVAGAVPITTPPPVAGAAPITPPPSKDPAAGEAVGGIHTLKVFAPGRTRRASVVVRGRTFAKSMVLVSGGVLPVTTFSGRDGRFSAGLLLRPNRRNPLKVTALSGTRRVSARLTVVGRRNYRFSTLARSEACSGISRSSMTAPQIEHQDLRAQVIDDGPRRWLRLAVRGPWSARRPWRRRSARR